MGRQGLILIGGGHMDEVEVLSPEPIEFIRADVTRIDWGDHLNYPG